MGRLNVDRAACRVDGAIASSGAKAPTFNAHFCTSRTLLVRFSRARHARELSVDGKPYTITTTFSGRTDNVACSVDEKDLELTVGPPQADTVAYNTHAIRFRLRSYEGGGTYELARSADEGSGHGFELQGTAGGGGADEHSAVAATMACGPSPCRAIVAPESEPIPNDDVVHEFRLRVEIQCDAGGKLWWHPDCAATDCDITSAPTIYFDIQCSH